MTIDHLMRGALRRGLRRAWPLIAGGARAAALVLNRAGWLPAAVRR